LDAPPPLGQTEVSSQWVLVNTSTGTYFGFRYFT
jgi:hypothetical protein